MSKIQKYPSQKKCQYQFVLQKQVEGESRVAVS